MNENYYLLLALILMYILESVIYLNQGAIILYATFFRKWNYKALKLFSIQVNRQVFIGNLFWPLHETFIINSFPLQFSKDGIISKIKNNKVVSNIFLFEDINSVSSLGKYLYINDKIFIKLNSEYKIRNLKKIIINLKKININERESKIEKILKESFSEVSIDKKLKLFNQNVFFVRIFSNTIFTLLFCVLPVYYYFYAFDFIFIMILCLIEFFIILTEIVYYKKHKCLYPDLKEERITTMLIILFSPFAAIRTIHYLSKNLLVDFNPYVVINKFCDKHIFEKAIEGEIRKNEFYEKTNNNSKYNEISDWFENLNYKFLLDYLVKYNIKKEKFLNSPEPENDIMKKYCPVCLIQYVENIDSCSECGSKIVSI